MQSLALHAALPLGQQALLLGLRQRAEPEVGGATRARAGGQGGDPQRAVTAARQAALLHARGSARWAPFPPLRTHMNTDLSPMSSCAPGGGPIGTRRVRINGFATYPITARVVVWAWRRALPPTDHGSEDRQHRPHPAAARTRTLARAPRTLIGCVYLRSAKTVNRMVTAASTPSSPWRARHQAPSFS